MYVTVCFVAALYYSVLMCLRAVPTNTAVEYCLSVFFLLTHVSYNYVLTSKSYISQQVKITKFVHLLEHMSLACNGLVMSLKGMGSCHFSWTVPTTILMKYSYTCFPNAFLVNLHKSLITMLTFYTHSCGLNKLQYGSRYTESVVCRYIFTTHRRISNYISGLHFTWN